MVKLTDTLLTAGLVLGSGVAFIVFVFAWNALKIAALFAVIMAFHWLGWL